MVLAVVRAGAHAGFGRDGHHRLADGLLPALAHLLPDTGRRQDGIVQAAVVLPDVVHHDGGDDFKAVRVAGLGEVAVVLCRLHLEDLRQRDLLQGRTQIPPGLHLDHAL